MTLNRRKLDYGHRAGERQDRLHRLQLPEHRKELAFHHLRSTMIGNSLARIYKAGGCKVERINHLGDWGTAFSKLIVMYLRDKLDGPGVARRLTVKNSMFCTQASPK